MKKLLLVLTMALGVAVAVAQPKAIGARLGYGVDVNYQHNLNNNFLDFEAGLPGFNGFQAAVTYNWVDPFNTKIPWTTKGSWDWYLGVGGKGGLYSLNESNNCWFTGVLGRIGVEYNFWFPLNLSLDWSPCVGLWNNADKIAFNSRGLYVGGIALGVRYSFGK